MGWARVRRRAPSLVSAGVIKPQVTGRCFSLQPSSPLWVDDEILRDHIWINPLSRLFTGSSISLSPISNIHSGRPDSLLLSLSFIPFSSFSLSLPPLCVSPLLLSAGTAP